MNKILAVLLTVLMAVVLTGCEPEVETVIIKKKRPKDESAKTEKPADTPEKEPEKVVTVVGFGSKKGGSSGPSTSREVKPVMSSDNAMGSGHDATWAAHTVTSDLRDAVKTRKALAIYVVDQSDANGIRKDVGQRIADGYPEIEAAGPGNLLSAVVTAGSDVKFVTPEPTADATVVQAALTGGNTSSAAAKLFEGIKAAAEKFRDIATKDKRDVILVVISKTGGGDREKLEDAVAALKQFPAGMLTLYSITSPTNFKAAGDANDPSATLLPETIPLDYWGSSVEQPSASSGFGPWNMGRLAAAVKPGYVLLLDTSPRWSAKAMEKYKPDYVSEKDYAELMRQNKARKALHEAAKLREVKVFKSAGTNIRRPDPTNARDTAAFGPRVSGMQRAAADVLKDLEKLSEILLAGESDSKSLPPRFKVEYDLALARALANRARADGYDSLLAAIKTKSPKDPKNLNWKLEEDNECTELSNINSWCKKSRKLLEGIAKEHPGTPWADIAENELTKQYGWKLSEQP